MTRPNARLQTNSATSRALPFDQRTRADSSVVSESLRSGDRLALASPWRELSAKALADEIRNLDKKRPAITTKAGFQLTSERVEPVTANVIVVADIEGGSRIWRVAKQQLAANT